MSTTKSIIQNDLLKDIKLPAILKKTFYIHNNLAICKTCNSSWKPKEINILFHLAVCSGTLIGEKIKTQFKFNCLICNIKTSKFYDWKKHLFNLNHLRNIYTSDKMAYSYDCNSCETHFYGFKEKILLHHCKPKELSKLSLLMAYIYESFDNHLKCMMYYCSECSNWSYENGDLHTNKHCKVAENTTTHICKTCSITFYDSNKQNFLNHRVSFEHLILWCLNSNRTEMKITSKSCSFKKLPLYISKYYEFSLLLQKARCIVCDKIAASTYDFFYYHFQRCICTKGISVLSDCTPVKSISCKLCNYEYSGPHEETYICWINHVISFEHFSKSIIIKKKKIIYSFYSYYCYVSETIFYGSNDFIKTQILKTNSEIGRLLFVSEVMAEVYIRSITNLNNILICCGHCKKYLDNKCEHYINIDQIQILHCSTCLVEFNVESDYNEHLLSSEHIILKYFKSNEIGEKKFFEYSMLIRNFNVQKSLDKSNHDQNVSDEEIDIHLNSYDSESQSLPDETNSSLYLIDKKSAGTISKPIVKKYSDSENLRNKSVSSLSSKNVSEHTLAPHNSLGINMSILIDELCTQPKKSAFNNYLRIHFELLSEMSLAINNFANSKSFFCDICNLIFCNESDWIEHDTDKHHAFNNHLICYCAVCNIYQISTSRTIDDHVKSVEHNVMLKFQKYFKINKNVNTAPINENQDFITENKDVEQNQKSKICKNRNIFIEIDGINEHLKKEDYCELKIIMRKYGEFKQFANKKNSFLILPENVVSVKALINDKLKLEKQHGFKILVIGQNKEKILSLRTIKSFSSWLLLCTEVFNLLSSIKANNCQMHSKLKELYQSVNSLMTGSESNVIHIFGSLVYGLSTKDSDVDLYLEIGHTFNGEISNDMDKQVNFVKKFAEQCLLKNEEFQNVEQICDTRVPILKFYHVPTKLNCDLSFKSGLSTYNSKLIKLYLSMDRSVTWLVCAIVKHWAAQNDLKSKNMFTSYALIWLVLFYLMTKNIIPPLSSLMKTAKKEDHKIIEGWDCSFGNWSGSLQTLNRRDMLLGFFQYYSDSNKLKNYVLCTITGKCMEKKSFFKNFIKLPEINEIQLSMFKTWKPNIFSNFERCNGLTVQDPFELSFNITKKITGDNLSHFCELCDQTSALL